MPNSDEVPPVSFQKALIGTNLHTSYFLLVFAGVQMMVYLWTIQSYLSRKAPNHRIVISALTILTGSLFGQTAVQWYYADVIYVKEGTTRLDVYNRAFRYDLAQPWFNMMTVMLENIAFLAADGLLMWRCFHVCGRSFRRIAVPLLFFSAEIALVIVNNVVSGLLQLHYSDFFGTLFDYIDGTLNCITATTSIIGTFIIGYRIHSSEIESKHKQKYTYIVEVMVQSSAMYSVAVLGEAIIHFVPRGDLYQYGRVVMATCWLGTTSVIVTSLAPTLMIARLALSAERMQTTELVSVEKLSALQFERVDSESSGLGSSQTSSMCK